MILLIFLSCLLIQYNSAHPTGAPPQACETMLPGHSNNQPKADQCPIIVKVDVQPNESQRESTVAVELSSPVGNSPGFKGFLVQMRSEANKIVGQWEMGNVESKPIECDGGANNAVTHTNPGQKKQISLKWKGMSELGVVHLFYTVVETYPVFWVQQKINNIDLRNAGKYSNNNSTLSEPFNTSTQPGMFGPGQFGGGEPGQPGQQPGQPGQQPGQPGQQPDQPGQQPGQPGQQPGQPGQQPGMPGQQPGMPGQQHGQPGQQPGQFGQQPGQPGQQPGQPGQQPGQPGHNPDRPFDPSNPGLGVAEQDTPGSGPAGSHPNPGGQDPSIRLGGDNTGSTVPPYHVDQPGVPGSGQETTTEMNNFFGSEFSSPPNPSRREHQPNSGKRSAISFVLIFILFTLTVVVNM